MQARHVPRIDLRYWCGIILASVFGTNLGDLYAHDSGLGLGYGLLVLVLVFAASLVAEASDTARHEVYYWFAIIVIRTGATNIADYLAYRLRIPALLLTAGLAVLIAALAYAGSAYANSAERARADTGTDGPPLVGTSPAYWAAMLAAGVFGTVAGDVCAHRFGQGPASIGLTMLFATLLAGAHGRATRLAAYWCIVALARTAGTCVGDWCAESRWADLGLPLSTLLTGAAFAGVLTLWGRPPADRAAMPGR